MNIYQALLLVYRIDDLLFTDHHHQEKRKKKRRNKVKCARCTIVFCRQKRKGKKKYLQNFRLLLSLCNCSPKTQTVFNIEHTIRNANSTMSNGSIHCFCISNSFEWLKEKNEAVCCVCVQLPEKRLKRLAPLR